MRFYAAFATFSLLLGSSSAAGQSDTCYEVGYGLVHPANGWYPCNNTAPAADGTRICCSGGDTCSQDGLCRGIALSGDTIYYNAGCTDSSYKNPLCRNTCIGSPAIYVAWSSDDHDWTCCGKVGYCTAKNAATNITFTAVSPMNFPLLPSASSTASTASTSAVTTSMSASALSTGASHVAPSPSTAADAAHSPTAAATSPPQSSASSTSPASSTSSSTKLSAGTAAGIAVAVCVGVLAIVSAIFWFVRRRRSRAQVGNQHQMFGAPEYHEAPSHPVSRTEEKDLWSPRSPPAELNSSYYHEMQS